ncbi:hypothetical protein BKA62DRAFT_756016 [Auriculariales sp. MPI-PUGE-AT-0066]|nr:hypothetical protein BKA62DRAFT_756016 [Auriculariales sp. MPI-PUGE-AT-0066]
MSSPPPPRPMSPAHSQRSQRSQRSSTSQRSVSFRVDKPILLACIGSTHSGRSSFVRTVAQLPHHLHSTTYCGTGIEEFVLDLDGQKVMLLDIPYLVDQDSNESEEQRLLEEHLEYAYKSHYHLSGILMFTRITSSIPTMQFLSEGISPQSAPPSLTVCTTSWHRIDSTSSWGERREASLQRRYPNASLVRYDADLADADASAEHALDILRLAVRATEHAPGVAHVPRRPSMLQQAQAQAHSHSHSHSQAQSQSRASTPRMRRDSVMSFASDAADEVRSELLDVIASLKAEVENLRQAQEVQNHRGTTKSSRETIARRSRRLSLAGLKII